MRCRLSCVQARLGPLRFPMRPAVTRRVGAFRVLSSFQRTGGFSGRRSPCFGEPSKHLIAPGSCQPLFSLPANFLSSAILAKATPCLIGRSRFPAGWGVRLVRAVTGWRLPASCRERRQKTMAPARKTEITIAPPALSTGSFVEGRLLHPRQESRLPRAS